MLVRTAVSSFLFFFVSHTYAAGSFFVDKFGDDNSACNRSFPCLTISEAINRAGTNGRVTVGPGVYNEELTINHTGLRLTSSKGAQSTVIDLSSPENPVFRQNGMTIEADRVTFGQRNKGFTVRGGFTDVDIYAEGNGIRIEGNRIESSPFSRISVVMLGDSLTLRYNNIDSNFRNGVFISRPVAGEIGGKAWLVDNNRIWDTQIAFQLRSTAPNNRMRVTNNTVENSRSDGFFIDNMQPLNDLEVPRTTNTGDRHSNNSVQGLDGVGGSGFSFTGGNPQADRLRVFLADLDDVGFAFSSTTNASLRNSTVTGEQTRQADPNIEDYNTGVWILSSVGLKIQGNSVVNTNIGMRFSGEQTRLRFLNNNIWSSSECVSLLSGNVVFASPLFSRNFWGSAEGPDLSCDPLAQSLVDNGVIRFRPASTQN